MASPQELVIKTNTLNTDLASESSKINPKQSTRSPLNSSSSNRKSVESPRKTDDNFFKTNVKDSKDQNFVKKRDSKNRKEIESLQKRANSPAKLKKNDVVENGNMQRSGHLSVAHINKIAQLNMLYVKNQKKKFISEKYLLPKIKSESYNKNEHSTPTTTGNTLKINSGSMSNVSNLNQSKKENELLDKAHKGKSNSEIFNKNDFQSGKQKIANHSLINFDELLKKDGNKNQINGNNKKSLQITNFNLEDLKNRYSMTGLGNNNTPKEGFKLKNSFVINLAKNNIKISENSKSKNSFWENLMTDKKKCQSELKNLNETNPSVMNEKGEHVPDYSAIAKNLSKTVTKLNELKFLKCLSKSNYEPSVIKEDKPTNNIFNKILEKSQTLRNSNSQLEKIKLSNINSLKKSITVNFNKSENKLSLNKRFELFYNKRFKIKKSDKNLSFDLTDEYFGSDEENLGIFSRPKAKTDKINNSEIFKKFFIHLSESSSSNSLESASNYHNSEEENQNFYLKNKFINTTDPEELIGLEIKEKVNDILNSIIKNYPTKDSNENSDDESYQRNSIFTIFNYRPENKLLTIRRRKPGDERILTDEYEKSLRMEISDQKINRFNKKHHTVSKASKLNLKYLIDSNFPQFIKLEKESSDKLSEKNIKSSIQIKLNEIDFKRQEKLSKFIKSSNNFIEQIHINKDLEKHSRKNKIIKFYQNGFSKIISKIIEKKVPDSDCIKFHHEFIKHTPLILSRRTNDFLFDKYFDLFKELLLELLNQENDFYQLDDEGNKIGKTILQNFKIKKTKNIIKNTTIVSDFKSLVNQCDTGNGILKHFGIQNHVFVNNFVIRDCFHEFKENEKDNLDKFPDRSVDFTQNTITDNKFNERSHSDQLILKKNSNQNIVVRKKSISRDNINTFLHFNKTKEKGLKLPRRNKNNSNSNLHKLELTKFSILNNKEIFLRHNKIGEEILKRKRSEKKYKKQETLGSPMTKESTLFRTNEIKLKMCDFFDSPVQSLWFFIKDGNFHKFKEIFEKAKIYPEISDEDNNSLLNLAIQSNNYEIAEFLLSVGADVNSQNNEMNTPLHYAIAHKNFQLADMLINKKANEELLNRNNLTAWQCIGGEIE